MSDLLVIAIETNAFDEFNKLLDDLKGSETFDINASGHTLLMLASLAGSLDIVNLLLSVASIKVDHNDKDNATALYHAAKKGHTEVVRVLVAAGANVNIKNSGLATPLFRAAGEGHLDTVNLLIASGADVETRDYYDFTPLLWATKGGHSDVVKSLIAAKADVNAIDHNNNNIPIAVALESGFLDIVKILVNAGAEVDKRFYGGNTALIYSAKLGYGEIVSLLLDAKADIDASNDAEQTAMICACNCGHAEIVSLLIAVGVTLDTPDNRYFFPIHNAAENGHANVVKVLIEAKCDVNYIYYAFLPSPLHLAAINGNVDCVQLLLDAGANVDYHDTKNLDLNNTEMKGRIAGATALHYAVSNGNLEAAKSLIAYGADVKSTNEINQTPFAIALSNMDKKDFLPIIMYFIENGYNVDKDGNAMSYVTLVDKPDYQAVLFTPEFLTANLERHNYALWFNLLQCKASETTQTVISMVQQDPRLASLKDTSGRVATDVATAEKRQAINSLLLWHGKYRPATGKPEHQSATCFVYKAVDESRQDEDGNYIPVALKLMKIKSQFEREVNCRLEGFDSTYVVDIVAQYSPVVVSVNGDVIMPTIVGSAVLSKSQVESMFCVVMPLADRNMFVALKQERFIAQPELMDVKHIFTQLVKCVDHMHSKKFVHGDLKTLNIVRVGTQWKLIDLDASCRIGVDAVGAKSSSAYVPPEAVYIDAITSTAVVKSEATAHQYNFAPLIAHPSFDIWSLGCLLYQMCALGTPLFQASLDDNLRCNVADIHDEDSLWALAEWSSELKTKKLSRVANPVAKHLLSLLLSKQPEKRPDISHILSHPFLSGKKGSREVGTAAAFDVFISYRVASDAHHAEILYDLLTARGLKVWWDKKCLLMGEDWEQGFCAGLVNSRAFVCILSEGAIAHPTITWQNFNLLNAESRCDNVLVEHRLALELRERGLIEKIFPVMIGERSKDTELHEKYCVRLNAPHTHVFSVEEVVCKHLNNEGHGTPFHPNKTVASVCTEIAKCNGAYIVGEQSACFSSAVDLIVDMFKGGDDSTSKSVTKSGTVDKLRANVSVYSCECSASVKLLEIEDKLIAAHRTIEWERQENAKLLQEIAIQAREIERLMSLNK